MTIARNQLTSAVPVGEGHMARQTALLPRPCAHGAHHVLAPTQPRQTTVLRDYSQHLEVVHVRGAALRVDRVHDRPAHGVHHRLALSLAELPHHLKLLGHLVVLQLGGVELQAELPGALAHLEEGARPQLLLGPLVDQALQAEVRAHHRVAAAHREAHEAHRRGRARSRRRRRRAAPPAAPHEAAVAAAAGEGVVAARRAALPVEDDAVGVHRPDVLHQPPEQAGVRRKLLRGGQRNAHSVHRAAVEAVGADALALHGHGPDLAEHRVV
mmetsp:Transcript_92158/g.257598  ORF Transcript_92158/g.257598 Transcript_92158/m.257598 type:complete len:269 (+) Transcript_92158:477-1283(+)